MAAATQRHDQQTTFDRTAQLQAQLDGIKTRLTRLIDAFLDGHLDKQSFEERKRTLLEEQRSLEDSQRAGSPDPGRATQLVVDTFELASSAQQSYRFGNPASRRELAIRLCSNLTVAGKDVSVEPYFPLRVIAERHLVRGGGP